jgi:hypothetical protein
MLNMGQQNEFFILAWKKIVSPPSFFLICVVAVEGPIHKILTKGKKWDKIKK